MLINLNILSYHTKKDSWGWTCKVDFLIRSCKRLKRLQKCQWLGHLDIEIKAHLLPRISRLKGTYNYIFIYSYILPLSLRKAQKKAVNDLRIFGVGVKIPVKATRVKIGAFALSRTFLWIELKWDENLGNCNGFFKMFSSSNHGCWNKIWPRLPFLRIGDQCPWTCGYWVWTMVRFPKLSKLQSSETYE